MGPSETATASSFDHMTLVVTDLDEALRFFGILGFKETVRVVASGETISDYMGIPDWESDHVTLALPGAPSHQEVQLLRFHTPRAREDPESGKLDRTGFNHVCFRVDDVEAMRRRLEESGFCSRGEPLTFHDRILVFFQGPAGVTVELAQWLRSPDG
jgi:catechol 2,3-dioxygenase-like lactoylglutathione lyase family enzyme